MTTFQWTGAGCDVCGFGTVEDVDEFDPCEPCPECGAVMLPETVDDLAVKGALAFIEKMTSRGVVQLTDDAVGYHLALLLKTEWTKLASVACGNCNTKGTLTPLTVAKAEPSLPIGNAKEQP